MKKLIYFAPLDFGPLMLTYFPLQVGGLPLPELNHLEIQFLVLNDFRLSVSVEDLEAYATMLVEFYAREVIGARSRSSASAAPLASAAPATSTATGAT